MPSGTTDCGEDGGCKARGREEGLPVGFLLKEWIKGVASLDEPLYEELIEGWTSLDAVRQEEFRELLSIKLCRQCFALRHTKKKIGKMKRKKSTD